MGWHLEIGEEASRTSIQEKHKGSNSRGISAPAKGSGLNNIMLWWDPKRGEEVGYTDGWATDGSAFYFSGMGLDDDQGFGAPHSENGRLRDHVENGDRVRLLRYVGKNRVRYTAELELMEWWWRDGFDRMTQPRKMIEFKLRPIGDYLKDPQDPTRTSLDGSAAVSALDEPPEAPAETALEALRSPGFTAGLRTRQLVGERREAQLVHDFAAWLRTDTGRDLTGLSIPYAAEERSLRADAFLPSDGGSPPVLVEAKASASRESVRMAIGQLLDYRRYIDPSPRLCLLVPSQVPTDMLALLDEVGIAVVHRQRSGFAAHGLDL